MEVVLRKIGEFKGESKFSTWTEAITRNLCRDSLREKIRKKLEVSFEDVDLEGGNLESQVNSQIELDGISDLLEPGERDLLLLKLEGASFKEIQERLSLNTEETARTRWGRLRKKILEEMGNVCRM